MLRRGFCTVCLAIPLDMASLSEVSGSLGTEGNLQTAKDPVPAGAELCAGVAANETEPGTSVQTGEARSGTEVTLPSNEKDRAMSTGVERAANNDTLLLGSPVWPRYSVNHVQRRRASKTEEGAIRNGNGELLQDEDGYCMFVEPGWRVIRDQSGMVCWDSDGKLCFEQIDEDRLTLITRSVPRQAPESLFEQVQQLQTELEQLHANLEQSQSVHRSDVELVQQQLAQAEAQKQADFRAMTAEMEKRKMEHQQSLRMQKLATNDRWANWMQQLQTAQAEKEKDAADEYTAESLNWNDNGWNRMHGMGSCSRSCT